MSGDENYPGNAPLEAETSERRAAESGRAGRRLSGKGNTPNRFPAHPSLSTLESAAPLPLIPEPSNSVAAPALFWVRTPFCPPSASSEAATHPCAPRALRWPRPGSGDNDRREKGHLATEESRLHGLKKLSLEAALTAPRKGEGRVPGAQKQVGEALSCSLATLVSFHASQQM